MSRHPNRCSRWSRLVAAATLILALAGTAGAEMWPTLDKYVSGCVLIVLAETHAEPGGTLTFEVLESWRGDYKPGAFAYPRPDGRFTASQGEHGVDVVDGQQIVFFFSNHNQPVPGKLARHSTAFPVVDGKIVWASTSMDRHEYSLPEFKKAVQSIP